jgi:site-specific DNA-methyltransferase (adenine-specific)
MRWLLTLVTPPGGTVLDPFAGSGTTGVACAALGIPCVLIEQEAEYLPIIAGRIDHALNTPRQEVLP